MLLPEEVAQIKAKTVFDEDSASWVVPHFYFKPKEVQLPTIQMQP